MLFFFLFFVKLKSLLLLGFRFVDVYMYIQDEDLSEWESIKDCFQDKGFFGDTLSFYK